MRPEDNIRRATPSPATPPGGIPPQDAGTTCGLAVASMVLGILGFVSWGILGIVGLFLGFAARKQTKHGQRRGDGMAITGIVLGWISLAWLGGCALLLIAANVD